MKVSKSNEVTINKVQLQKMMKAAFALGQLSQTGAKANRASNILEILNAVKSAPGYEGWAIPLRNSLYTDKAVLLKKCKIANSRRATAATN